MDRFGGTLTGATALGDTGPKRIVGGKYALYVYASAFSSIALHYSPSEGGDYVPAHTASAVGVTVLDLPGGFYDITTDGTTADGHVALIAI